MNPRDFLSLAKDLAKANTPANLRSAISRAYYAAFLVGVEVLGNLGFRISKGAAGHGEAARCFENSGNAHVVGAGRLLAELHGSRIRADYRLDKRDVEDAATVALALKDAESIIDSFDAIQSNANRPAIQSAIASWRKSNGYP